MAHKDKKANERVFKTCEGCRNVLLAVDKQDILTPLILKLHIALEKTVELPASDVKEVEEFLGDSPHPDVIILDTQLQGDQSTAILKLLISRKLDIPIILLGAHKFEKQPDFTGISIDKLNIAGRLNKPIDHNELCGKVIDIIMEKQKEHSDCKLVKDIKNVLLAIDDAHSLDTLNNTLSSILAKGNAQQACDIETEKKNLNDIKPPDLIIIDEGLKDNTAKAILKLIASRKASIPLILLDSHKLEREPYIDDINVVGYSKKPLDRRKLFTLIEKALKGRL